MFTSDSSTIQLSFTYNNLKALECINNAIKQFNEVSNYMYDFEEEKDDPEMQELATLVLQTALQLTRLENSFKMTVGSAEHEAKREEWRKLHNNDN